MRSHAFTMPEFFVLAVIVAILASLSIPTLSSQRRLAMAASCQGNLKELQVGVLLYAMESDDFLPPVEYVPGSDEAFHGQPEAYGWFTLNPLVVPFPQTWGEWQAARNAKQGGKGSALLLCPQCPPQGRPRSQVCYQAAPAAGWSRRFHQEAALAAQTAPLAWRRRGQIQNPEKTVMYLDGAPEELSTGFAVPPQAVFLSDSRRESHFRHDGAVHLSLLDGHVEKIPFLKANAMTDAGIPFWQQAFHWFPEEDQTP